MTCSTILTDNLDILYIALQIMQSIGNCFKANCIFHLVIANETKDLDVEGIKCETESETDEVKNELGQRHK